MHCLVGAPSIDYLLRCEWVSPIQPLIVGGCRLLVRRNEVPALEFSALQYGRLCRKELSFA